MAYAAAAAADGLPPAARRRALVAAATCFLAVDELNSAATCIQTARDSGKAQPVLARAS